MLSHHKGAVHGRERVRFEPKVSPSFDLHFGSNNMMQLYLVQHGECKTEEEDPERRLTTNGIGEVQKSAEFLRAAGVHTDVIWHSGKARAQQTAEILADAVGAREEDVLRREG